MNFTGHSEKRTRDIPLPFQWPVWLPTPSSPLLLVSELRQAPQALRIWAHIGAHHSCCSLICPLLGAAHRLWNGAGSLPRMGAVSTWGKGWNPFPSPLSLVHCPPTPALAVASGLCLGSCCLFALPVSLPLSSPVSAFLLCSYSSLPTAFLSLCLWPHLCFSEGGDQVWPGA